MCGFVVSCRSDAGLSVQSVVTATERLAHRGPDGQTLWRSPEGHCVMGFRRLALVGPMHETQPFHAGAHAAVVNGEIYGYQAWRDALTARGARFSTSSDCEVVMHAFREADADVFGDINGEFALVIWDESRRQLIAARDRWGVKPLFYRQTPGGIQLASEVKALGALGPPLRWDRERLFQHLLAALGPEQTLFSDVRQVPPGHVLEWIDGVVVLRPYVKRATAISLPVEASPATAAALMPELRSALTGAVHDRFQGEAEVGFYLSGGLDSSAMLACAAERRSPSTLTAFTVAFASDDADALQAAGIAATLGVRHERLQVSSADIADAFGPATHHAETLGFNAIGAVRWLLGREASRSGFKAIMTGDGADELFAGYGFSVMERLVHLAAGQGLAHVKSGMQRSLACLSEELGWPLAPVTLDPRHGTGFLVESWNHQRCGIRHLLAAPYARTVGGGDPFDMLFASIGPVDGEGLRRSMQIWQRSLFVNQILVSERLDMAHGVEARYPYLDDRVAAVAARLPDAWLVDQSREKYFLRETVAAWLPAAGARTMKKAFEAPRNLLRTEGPFRNYMMDAFHSHEAHDSSILDWKKLIALAERLPSLSRDAGDKADAMLMMALSFLEVQKGLCVAD